MEIDFDKLNKSHDAGLSDWGPYTKRYMGFSHIPDVSSGVRFDLSIFPGFYRQKVMIPNVNFNSDYHAWLSTPDLSFVCHRHDLEWKDQVYCDVSFLRQNENEVLIQAELVNNTDKKQNLTLHYMGSINFPNEKHPAKVSLKDKALWIDALAYADYTRSSNRHDETLVYDGQLLGAFRDNGMVDGQGIYRFGRYHREKLQYNVEVKAAYRYLLIRYRSSDNSQLKITIAEHDSQIIDLPKSDIFTEVSVDLPELSQKECTLTIESLECSNIDLDGLALVKREGDVEFTRVVHNLEPKREIEDNSLILKYDEINTFYGIKWEYQDFEVREFICEDLDNFYKKCANQHVHTRYVDHNHPDGHFSNVFLNPVFLEPNSSIKIMGYICCDRNKKGVKTRLTDWDSSAIKQEQLFINAAKRAEISVVNPSGEGFLNSQNRMKAMVSTNIVYPVRTQNEWIRHYTPGRAWDSLYTWDSGFIGLGLAEVDMERAIYNLNAYLTNTDCKNAAFIHHGSPVPVQFYQFMEIWNQTESKELLSYFYPRLQQYHRFMAGRLGSSNTDCLKSGMLKTWDYFYNSGGWDDYPPQSYVHKLHQEANVAPVVITANVIRTAKILKMLATQLGEDTHEYDADIERFTNALQNYSWDDESGYFGYVEHNSDGEPVGIMRHPDGSNYNMGLGGVSPLLSGICSAEQTDVMVKALMDSNKMWSACGLSTVDQSASYYRHNGYWNGAVWMPHQWFMWKALLGLGKADEAHKIAATALDVWKNEVDASYNCFEHFIVETGRGAGWHHFSGLSSPVLCWFNSYHKPGKVTTGLDTVVETAEWSELKDSLNACLWHSAETPATVIVTLAAGKNYSVLLNGVECNFVERYSGCLEISLPAGDERFSLNISC